MGNVVAGAGDDRGREGSTIVARRHSKTLLQLLYTSEGSK